MRDEESEIIKENATRSNRRNTHRPDEMTITATLFVCNRSQLV